MNLKIIIFFILLTFGIIPVSKAGTCPHGMKFSKKYLRCIRKKITTCPMKSYLKSGKCIDFKFGKLKRKKLKMVSFDFTKLSIAPKNFYIKGITHYNKFHFNRAIYFLKKAWDFQKQEVIGYYLIDSYRRTGQIGLIISISSDFISTFPKSKFTIGLKDILKKYNSIKKLNKDCIISVPNSCKKLQSLLTAEVNSGYYGAASILGGNYIKKNQIRKAEKLFLNLCNQGYLRGCSSLGYVYYSLSQKKNLGLRYYKKGCAGGGAFECHLAGMVYNYKQQNIIKSITYFKTGCSLGLPLSCSQLFVIEMKQKQYRNPILKYLNKACKKKNFDACENATRIYRRTDIKKFKWLSKYACNSGDAKSCYNLGTYYFSKSPKSKDTTLYLSLGCTYGHMKSCKLLGKIYYENLKFYTMGLKYYKIYYDYTKRLCKYGEAFKCAKVGDFYRFNMKNNKEAMKWYKIYMSLIKTHCKKGEKHYCPLIAQGYQYYLKDPKTALKLFSKECKKGNSISCRRALAIKGEKIHVGTDVRKTYYNKLNTSCLNGDLNKCNLLSDFLISDKKYDSAIKILDKGCKKKNYAMCNKIASLYILKKDYKNAINYYQISCKNNNLSSCVQITSIARRILKNDALYKTFSIKACKLGSTPNCITLAKIYKKNGDKKKSASFTHDAIKIWNKRCKKNDESYCKKISDTYGKILNNRTKKLYYLRKYLKIIRKKCKNNNYYCKRYPSVLYNNFKNKKSTLRKLIRMCKQNGYGCYYAGLFYERIRKNNPKALNYYKKGCKKGKYSSCLREKILTRKINRNKRIH